MTLYQLRFVAPLLAILALAACGSSEPPTFGERLSHRGDDVQKLGSQWSEGNDLILKGHDLVKSGQEEAADAQEELEDARVKANKGQSMITKGTTMKTNAENTYQQKYHRPLIQQ